MLSLVACKGATGPSDGGAITLSPETWAALLVLSPPSLPPPPADITNRFADDPEAALFGQRLFFDPSFSGPLLDSDNDGTPSTLGNVGDTGRVSCAGCHLPAYAFSDKRSFQLQISLGAGWGRRRTPSLLDVGQARMIMWDGRRDTLFNQVFGPLESVVEMNSSRLYMAEQLFARHRTQYEALFGPMPPLDDTARFPSLSATVTGCQPSHPSDPAPTCDGPFHGSPGDGAEYDGMTAADQAAVTRVVVNAGKAIGAYERLLTCGPSPFDSWMHGGPDLPEPARRGAGLFVGAAGCSRCHSGPYLTDQTFHNVGLVPHVVQSGFIDSNDEGGASGMAAAIQDPLSSHGVFSDGDDGRLPPSPPADAVGAFRTPSLRCVALRPTYMHTGQLRTLSDVVTHFNNGGSIYGFPGTNELEALSLTAQDQADLVAFMKSLTGPGPQPQLLSAP